MPVHCMVSQGLHCSLNIVFFLVISVHIYAAFPSVSAIARAAAAAAEPPSTCQIGHDERICQSSEKSKHFKEKTQYLMNSLKFLFCIYYPKRGKVFTKNEKKMLPLQKF